MESSASKVDSQCVLILGNFSEGFRFIGPFDSFDSACNYPRNEMGSWVATLESPLRTPETLLKKTLQIAREVDDEDPDR